MTDPQSALYFIAQGLGLGPDIPVGVSAHSPVDQWPKYRREMSRWLDRCSASPSRWATQRSKLAHRQMPRRGSRSGINHMVVARSGDGVSRNQGPARCVLERVDHAQRQQPLEFAVAQEL